MTTTIPLFFAVDDRYAPYLAVTLTSIIQNSDPQQQYEAIILHDHLSTPHQQRLAALATDNVHVRIVQMSAAFAQRMANDHSQLRCDYHTLTIFFPAVHCRHVSGIPQGYLSGRRPRGHDRRGAFIPVGSPG
ncbi:hypothetical protein [Lacticaseibacillus thailandensis]|uniref:hypothetical protein n=1 Tax=Lacticaseibacillus thailandensis TaxID=381741 RepID=UPI000A6580E4|nr:hypothetical protein [Lacticaseibacillus thailandensis]